MTLYTWRALARGWREPNWRIVKFWAPLLALAAGVILLIGWAFAPLPRWTAFVVGVPLGIGAMNAGAWLAGATRKPTLEDRLEAAPTLQELLEDLTGPREFLPTVPGTQVEFRGPPKRDHPCWKCRTYRRWPRDRRHWTCAPPVELASYVVFKEETPPRLIHDMQHRTNVQSCPYCTEEQNRRGV